MITHTIKRNSKGSYSVSVVLETGEIELEEVSESKLIDYIRREFLNL